MLMNDMHIALSLFSQNQTFKMMLLSLCLFHGVVLERRKFGALGFNIPYEMTDGDLRICISQLQMFLTEYEDIPYKVCYCCLAEVNPNKYDDTPPCVGLE